MYKNKNMYIYIHIYTHIYICTHIYGLPVPASGKEPARTTGDTRKVGLIPGLGRCPGEGNGNPLQFSCLGNPMDRGTWRATVDRVEKSWTQLK